MSDFKNSAKKIGLHIVLVLATILVLSFLFLKVFLPSYTNHGQTVTVPDLEGYDFEQLDSYLSSRDLQYEVTLDSGYNAELKPFSVLKQNPKAGEKVKQGRKIYVTLNSKNAPLVK
ncbi:MAG: PASTA domain-containing protein, partial [Cyclobacteriaceae bacterium]|nr:PASTA domain-containing protein [Cyclobacteriaceae bacterium]